MSRTFIRVILIVLAAAAVVALIGALLHLYVFPKLSYRHICVSIAGGESIESANYVYEGKTIALTHDQILAMITWLADYRSENEGIERIDFIDDSGVALVLSMKNGNVISLYPDRFGICFSPGCRRQRPH